MSSALSTKPSGRVSRNAMMVSSDRPPSASRMMCSSVFVGLVRVRVRSTDATALGQVPIDVVWNGASGRTVSRVEDLSVSGCFVGSLAAPSLGERVHLEINLPPKHEHLSIDAEVVYCEPNIGFGVRFLGLLTPAQHALSFAVDTLTGKSLPLWLLLLENHNARCSFRLLVPSGLELSVKVDERPDLTERFNSWDELVARSYQQRDELEAGGWVLVP